MARDKQQHILKAHSSQKLRKYCTELPEVRSNLYCTSEILLRLKTRGKKATVKCKEGTHLKEEIEQKGLFCLLKKKIN